jgi:hypothetical protein
LFFFFKKKSNRFKTFSNCLIGIGFVLFHTITRRNGVGGAQTDRRRRQLSSGGRKWIVDRMMMIGD